jgi:ABC-type transport system involved in multi-copper enzyme maturation permease subunit
MSAVLNKIAIIARFTLLEAVRTRLPLVTLAIMALLFLGGLFVQHISVTETARMQTGFLAAALRLSLVFILSLHVAASMVREFNDKGVELLLSLDLPRAGYYLGRFLGFAGIALALALAAGGLLFTVVHSTAVAWWTASLAFELTLVAALALFCVITFVQIMPAISFVVAFYLLARGISAVRLLAASPLLSPAEWSNRAVAWLVDGLAWLLPDLGRFTPTSWLVDQSPDFAAVGSLALQSLIYGAVLVCAGLYDLYRKSL